MIELLLASFDGTADCVYRQWFLEVFLGTFSVNDRIMLMSDAVSSEGPQASNKGLLPCHRDLSSLSESIDAVMHCKL